jgi:hypothetical protein
LVSPYAPASASIMYPSYGLPHGGVITLPLVHQKCTRHVDCRMAA